MASQKKALTEDHSNPGMSWSRFHDFPSAKIKLKQKRPRQSADRFSKHVLDTKTRSKFLKNNAVTFQSSKVGLKHMDEKLDDIAGFSSSDSDDDRSPRKQVCVAPSYTQYNPSQDKTIRGHGSDLDEEEDIYIGSSPSCDGAVEIEGDVVDDDDFNTQKIDDDSIHDSFSQQIVEDSRAVEVVGQHSDPSEIEEMSPTPEDRIKASLLKLTDAKEVFRPLRLDLSTVDDIKRAEDTSMKRKKLVKGGLAEQYQKLTARQKSEETMMIHSRKNCTDFEKIVHLQVCSSQVEYSVSLLQCNVMPVRLGCQIYLVLPCSQYKMLNIKDTDVLRVRPPFQKIWLPSLHSCMLVSVSFIETLQKEELPSFSVTNATKDLMVYIESNGPGDDIIESKVVCLPPPKLQLSSIDMHQSIVKAVELSKETKGITFSGRIQRICLRHVKTLPVSGIGSFSKYIQEKSFAGDEVSCENLSIVLIVEDEMGFFSEIIIPFSALRQKRWLQLVVTGEGQHVFFKDVLLSHRITHNRNPSLSSLIESINKVKSSTSEKNALRSSQLMEEFKDDIDDCSKRNHLYSYSFYINENSSSAEFSNELKQPSYSEPDILSLESISASPEIERCSVIVKFYAMDFNHETGRQDWFVYDVKNCDKKKRCSQVFKICKLKYCYVSEVIRGELLNQPLLIRDLRVVGKDLYADLYTKIMLVRHCDGQNSVTQSTFLEDSSWVTIQRRELDDDIVPVLGELSKDIAPGMLCILKGVICGLNEDTALFWNVCQICGGEDLREADNGSVYCDTCKKETGCLPRMQLDIFVVSQAVPGMIISVKLQESTIHRLLPATADVAFEGYDVCSILNKTFGPSPCLVIDTLVTHDNEQPEKSIHLKELELLYNK